MKIAFLFFGFLPLLYVNVHMKKSQVNDCSSHKIVTKYSWVGISRAKRSLQTKEAASYVLEVSLFF